MTDDSHLSEEITDVTDECQSDPFLGARVEYQGIQGTITDISQGVESGVMVYRVTYNDGDVQDFDEKQLLTSVSFIELKSDEVGGRTQSLSKDFQQLLRSGQHSDVKLICNGQSLQVHKLILITRSPVFSSMFGTPMQEQSTGVIELNEFSIDAVRLLCEFMYTDSIEDETTWTDASVVADLLQAAVKYECLGLVRLCCSKVKGMLTVDNVADWTVVSARMRPSTNLLLYQCLQVLINKLADVQSTDGWERLMKNKELLPELMPLVFRALAPPRRKRKQAEVTGA